VRPLLDYKSRVAGPRADCRWGELLSPPADFVGVFARSAQEFIPERSKRFEKQEEGTVTPPLSTSYRMCYNSSIPAVHVIVDSGLEPANCAQKDYCDRDGEWQPVFGFLFGLNGNRETSRWSSARFSTGSNT